MQCTLHIPHLIPPREFAESLWRTVDAPQLKTLLARADFSRSAESGTDAGLCGAFGVARQQDWPLAPLLARSENLATESGYWLCATPVHLETRRNALVLTDPASLAMTAADSAAFAATLADHLREENVTLHAPQPACWFLRCDASPVMTTSSLEAVTGRDVRLSLPQGPDSPRWRRILTEIQMLLHAHPANDARETSGHAPVNSVWLWGGGTLPTPAPAAYDAVWSDDLMVRALTYHSACRSEPCPARIAVDALQAGSHFFSFEALAALMRQGDLQAWSNAVSALNRDWFNPLMHALKSRRLRTLSIISANDTGTQQFVIHPSDQIKFWRKNKYL